MTARRAILAIALALAVTVGAVGPVLASNSEINYDAGPNPFIEEDQLTVAQHDRDSMGVLDYNDDEGELTSLPATLNESKEEQVDIRWDRVDDDSLTQFPRGKSDVSWQNGSEWSTSGQNSSALSVTETEPTDGIDAVEFSTSFGSGDSHTATASFSNFSIGSDAEKRVPIVVANVDSLTAGATVDVNFTSSDGDAATATINPSGTADDDGVIATSTGDGYVWQHRLTELDVSGNDGSLEDIESVEVSVSGEDATVTLTGLAVEKKTELVLGDHRYDGDNDGDDEDHESVTEINGGNQSGYVGVISIETIDSAFDDATIRQLRVNAVQYHAEQLDASEVSVEYTDAEPDYPGFSETVETFYRLEVPQAIDLSHSGLSLHAEQKFVPDRYATVEYKEAAGGSDFEDIDSWSGLRSTYSEKGETHDLDDTVSAGDEYVFHSVIKLTSGDVATLQSTGGGAGGPVDEGSDGLLGWFIAAFSGIAGIGSRLANWGPLKGFPWVV